MFMGFMALVVVASAPLLGGRLRLLGSIRIRRAALIAAALAVQVVITTVTPDAPHGVEVGLHLATYAAAAVALWANRRLPGLLVLGAGGMLNGVVIALNGGTLPASRSALMAAGQRVGAPGFLNSGVLAHPILPFFGDILASPSWLPFRNVISIGDLMVLAGTAVLVHSVTRSWPAQALSGVSGGDRDRRGAAALS